VEPLLAICNKNLMIIILLLRAKLSKALFFVIAYLFAFAVTAQGIDMSNAIECSGDVSKKNLTQKIRVKVSAGSAALNWKNEIWMLKYDKTILDKNGDYVYQYIGHLFLLQISDKILNVIDINSKKLIFTDSLDKCVFVKYII
jgi:hypothetical protein